MAITVWVQNPANGMVREVSPEKAALLAFSGWPQVPPPGSGSTDPVDDVITRSEMVQYVAENGGGGGGGSTPDATTSVKGKARLLGGTADAPTVPATAITGTLDPARLPPLAIIDYLGAVASQSAMLALAGQKGDWCVRTDTGKGWIITGSDPTQLSSWTVLPYPAATMAGLADLDSTGAAAGKVVAVAAVDSQGKVTSWNLITPSGGGYTDELAQDAAAAMLVAGVHTNITATYNDVANRLDLAISGIIPDSVIPSGITRDSELSTAITAALDALKAGAPTALDTLDELAAAIGDDGNFAATVTTALGNRLRIDAVQSLTSGQKAQGRSNLAVSEQAVYYYVSGAYQLAPGNYDNGVGPRLFVGSVDPSTISGYVGRNGDAWIAPGDYPTRTEMNSAIASGGGGAAWLGVAETTVLASTGGVGVGDVNRTIWTRVLRGSVASASKIGVGVYVASGNISVAVHRNTGTGMNAAPGAQAATSGAVACPASGYREIPLLTSVPVSEGDWLALSADNTAFQTYMVGNGVQTGLFSHIACYGAGHPVPASPSGLTGIARQVHLVAIA